MENKTSVRDTRGEWRKQNSRPIEKRPGFIELCTVGNRRDEKTIKKKGAGLKRFEIEFKKRRDDEKRGVEADRLPFVYLASLSSRPRLLRNAN